MEGLKSEYQWARYRRSRRVSFSPSAWFHRRRPRGNPFQLLSETRSESTGTLEKSIEISEGKNTKKEKEKLTATIESGVGSMRKWEAKDDQLGKERERESERLGFLEVEGK